MKTKFLKKLREEAIETFYLKRDFTENYIAIYQKDGSIGSKIIEIFFIKESPNGIERKVYTLKEVIDELTAIRREYVIIKLANHKLFSNANYLNSPYRDMAINFIKDGKI